MATAVEPKALQSTHRLPALAESILETGDRLTRDEFERRYSQLKHLKKAELIEGTVYMPSPVRAQRHAEPHNLLGTWLGVYASETPVVKCFDNSTIRLDLDNEPQPDLVLGLWLNTPALLRGDLKAALETVRQSLASADHTNFAAS
jgi:hypothetical protein